MNKDQLQGRLKEAKGGIKKGAGRIVGNETLAAEGHIEKTAGRVQSAYGDLKNAIARNS